jgi:hypothetical protein
MIPFEKASPTMSAAVPMAMEVPVRRFLVLCRIRFLAAQSMISFLAIMVHSDLV